MALIGVPAPLAAAAAKAGRQQQPLAHPTHPVPDGSLKVAGFDQVLPEEARGRETFIPVTTAALMDRLTATKAWPAGESKAVHRFFRYLDFWRRNSHNARLIELLQAYEPFSPDSDLLITRSFTKEEKRVLQSRVIRQVEGILTQANYRRIDPSDVEMILTRESHYGLDLQVDFTAFEECLIYYRGASSKRDQRRSYRKFYRKEEFDVPIFQRLCLVFKLKPFDDRVREIMLQKMVSRKEAEKIVKRLRAELPPAVTEENIYLKLFKNIPRTDIEMCFPNPRVRFRAFDKLKLGVTAGGGLGMGLVGAAGKIALVASNPLAAAGAAVGLGGIAFRQFFNFLNQKQRYMVVLAQNLYFHAMADNRGVMIKLTDRAAEEDVKEEMLLYTVLVKEHSNRRDLPAIDRAIEQYLKSSFGVSVDFDLEDALNRLVADKLVHEDEDGTLTALMPREAAAHLDKRWDSFLDELQDIGDNEGTEVARDPTASRA
jgi:hypothetical protein